MSAPAVPKGQVCAEIRQLLSRALGRLVLAEAMGTLTPTEARVMREIRADMARVAAAQQRSQSAA